MNLFTTDHLWTMLHGIAFGGAAMMALAAALFTLYAVRTVPAPQLGPGPPRAFAWLSVFIAAMLWLTVIVGTYVVFPPYRAVPPEGTVALAEFPKSMIQANPDTEWLHSFAMESKEHVPWIAAMIATAVAFVGFKRRSRLFADASLRNLTATMLVICFALVAYMALLGVFVNKVAPVQ